MWSQVSRLTTHHSAWQSVLMLGASQSYLKYPSKEMKKETKFYRIPVLTSNVQPEHILKMTLFSDVCFISPFIIEDTTKI